MFVLSYFFYISMYHITQNVGKRHHVVYKCEVISINITILIG